MRNQRPLPAAGFSLLELMVGVSILGVLLALALPSFSEWVRNNQVRTVAEALREGLQLARSEAIKRNTRVRLQLVSTLDTNCALDTAGPYWVMNAGASVTPAGNCGAPVSLTGSPAIIQSSPVTSAVGKVTMTSTLATGTGTGAPVVAFDASGRQSAVTNPTTPLGTFTVQIRSSVGTCMPTGNVRCLRVVVTTSGEVRMCDPVQGGNTDPTRCY